MITIELKHSPISSPRHTSVHNILLLTANNETLILRFQINRHDKFRDFLQRAKLEVIMALGILNSECENIDIFDDLRSGYDMALYGSVENKPGLSIDDDIISIAEYYRQQNSWQLEMVAFYFRYMTSSQRDERNHYYNNNIDSTLFVCPPLPRTISPTTPPTITPPTTTPPITPPTTPPSPPPLPIPPTTIAENESLLCVICMEMNRRILLMPCRHLCMCISCSDNWTSNCPICRTHIRTVVTVFL